MWYTVLFQDFCLLSFCCFVLHVSFEVTLLCQVKVTGSGGQANIAWLSGAELKQKKTTLLLAVDQERSHMVQQCVTRTEACGQPVMHMLVHLLLSHMAFHVCFYHWLLISPWEHNYIVCFHDIFKFTSSAKPAFLSWCVCVLHMCLYVCVSVPLVKRVRCFTVAAAKGGRQRKPRPQRGCKWE